MYVSSYELNGVSLAIWQSTNTPLTAHNSEEDRNLNEKATYLYCDIRMVVTLNCDKLRANYMTGLKIFL